VTRADKLVIVGVLVAATLLGSSFWLWKAHNQITDVPQVIIEVNGEIKEQIPLTELKPGKQYQIQGVLGYSVVEGGENKVRMVESPCPDKICVGMGWIEHPGEVIVCLPNRVVVRIIGKSNTKLDGISQ
jgi:hypothetical protein